MKTLKILIGAAMALAFATANSAIGQINTPPQLKDPLRLTVSGTVKYQTVEDGYEGNTATCSFNEKTVYLLVSNYVAHAPDYSYGYIAGTNLPVNGYIAFNPNHNLFYVTNKAGFYYPLSGYVGNQFFSWIELDSSIFYGDDSGYLSFGDSFGIFNSVAKYHMDLKAYGSSACTSTAVLYIHDDPYNIDDASNPAVFWDNYSPWEGGPVGGSADEVGHNNSMIEIRGALTTYLHFSGFEGEYFWLNRANFSLSGAGNFYEHDIYDLNGVLTSGHASLTQ